MMTIARVLHSVCLLTGAMAAACALVACSGDEEPQGAADAAPTDASRDASTARPDARTDGGIAAQCRAVVYGETGPTCTGMCICDHCADLAVTCYNDPDCVAIVECAARTGCEGLDGCSDSETCQGVIAAHGRGFIAAVGVANCYAMACRDQCPTGSDAAVDGPREAAAVTDAREAATDGASNEREAGPDGAEASVEAAVVSDGEPGSDAVDGALPDGSAADAVLPDSATADGSDDGG